MTPDRRPGQGSPIEDSLGLAHDLMERVHSAAARWQVEADHREPAEGEAMEGEIDAALLHLAAAVAGDLLGLAARRRGGPAFIVTAAPGLTQSILDRAALTQRDAMPKRIEPRGIRFEPPAAAKASRRAPGSWVTD